MLTQERLKQVLYYDQIGGGFYWRNQQAAWIKPWSAAGTEDTHGYLQITVDGKKYQAHRLAWLYVTGEVPTNLIDHKNRVRFDNRFDNLRPATVKQNNENQSLMPNNTSGYRGVSWHKPTGKWAAKLMHNKSRIHVGLFATPEEAHQAVSAKRIELYTHAEN
jgi:hypothetical protein